MHRLLAAFLALSVALFVLASPSVVEAKPKDSTPRPPPTTRPTPTPSPTPKPTDTPAPTATPPPTATPTPTPTPARYVDGI
ncbi:MAG: hypothetical protein ACJ78L_06690, partial [Chloroflexota bacterium]